MKKYFFLFLLFSTASSYAELAVPFSDRDPLMPPREERSRSHQVIKTHSLNSALDSQATTPPNTLRCFFQTQDRICQLDKNEFEGYKCEDPINFNPPEILGVVKLKEKTVYESGKTLTAAEMIVQKNFDDRAYELKALATTMILQDGSNGGNHTNLLFKDSTTGIMRNEFDYLSKKEASIGFSYAKPVDQNKVREIKISFYCKQQKL